MLRDLPPDWTRCQPAFRDCPVKENCLRFTSRPKDAVKPLSFADYTVQGVNLDGDCMDMIEPDDWR